mmetsp:Transcript_97309/g.253588  ORF Transcript_97309/g.253588 Transcript_97309/m.253588 type:complete len:222 (-) Transcript_97309:126-791(-)
MRCSAIRPSRISVLTSSVSKRHVAEPILACAGAPGCNLSAHIDELSPRCVHSVTQLLELPQRLAVRVLGGAGVPLELLEPRVLFADDLLVPLQQGEAVHRAPDRRVADARAEALQRLLGVPACLQRARVPLAVGRALRAAGVVHGELAGDVAQLARGLPQLLGRVEVRPHLVEGAPVFQPEGTVQLLEVLDAPLVVGLSTFQPGLARIDRGTRQVHGLQQP